MSDVVMPSKEDLAVFKELIEENRYDFCKLVFLIFPFGLSIPTAGVALPI